LALPITLALAGIVAPLAAAPVAVAAPPANVQAIADDGNRDIDFNEGWQFFLVQRTTASVPTGSLDIPDPAQYPSDVLSSPYFDDSSWRTLTLPHDWSIEGPKVATGSQNSQGYLQGGLGWYR
jgi:beta-galactosidase